MRSPLISTLFPYTTLFRSCLLVKLDNLWQIPFPYVLTLHQSPTDGGVYRGFHFHIEIHPPLRQPNLMKYLAGPDRKSTRLNSSHVEISYAVFCLKKKTKKK